MSKLLCEDLVQTDIKTRASLLLAHGIALYDSVEECDIEGSSDSKIINARPADIPSFLAQADIKHIFCNGAAAYKYLVKFYPEYTAISTQFPSTSPANASYSLSKLFEEWAVICAYL